MNTEDYEDRMRKRRFYLFIAAVILVFVLVTTISNINRKEQHHDGVNVVQVTNTVPK